MAKFLAVDANGLNMVFGGEKISFVKKDCKKKNNIQKEDSTGNFSSKMPSDFKTITITSHCNPLFLFQKYNWNPEIVDIIMQRNTFHLSISKNLFVDSLRRPPRFI